MEKIDSQDLIFKKADEAENSKMKDLGYDGAC